MAKNLDLGNSFLIIFNSFLLIVWSYILKKKSKKFPVALIFGNAGSNYRNLSEEERKIVRDNKMSKQDKQKLKEKWKRKKSGFIKILFCVVYGMKNE